MPNLSGINGTWAETFFSKNFAHYILLSFCNGSGVRAELISRSRFKEVAQYNA
jgi:hypothetical protein